MINYLETKTIRKTPSGKRFVAYRYWESFGKDTGYAHSWGCQEKRGTGKIWVRPDEDIDAAIARRNQEYA